MAVLSGIVVSGQGNFGQWIEKLKKHYNRKTGMRLFPGTLNILLDYPYALPPDVIRLEKEEYGGTVSVSLVSCRIFDRRAFLVRTDPNEAGLGHHRDITRKRSLRLRPMLNYGNAIVSETEIGLSWRSSTVQNDQG